MLFLLPLLTTINVMIINAVMASTSALDLIKGFPATLGEHRHNLEIVRSMLFDELRLQHSAPSEGGWSVEEIAHHLGIVESGIVRGMTKRLSALTQPSPPADNAALEAKWRHNRAGFTDRQRKMRAPESVFPLNPPALDDSIRALQASRSALLDLLAKYSYDDIAAVAMPHPFFGVMSGLLWLDMIAEHEARHIEQIRDLRR
jgi:hypothetical protein